MNIYINNKLQELSSPALLTDALTGLNITSQKGIAVAINNNVIPRSEWHNYLLQAEDKVMIIKATQGG